MIFVISPFDYVIIFNEENDIIMNLYYILDPTRLFPKKLIIKIVLCRCTYTNQLLHSSWMKCLARLLYRNSSTVSETYQGIRGGYSELL